MKVDHTAAQRVLEEESMRAQEEAVPELWVARIQRLEELLRGVNLTFIAALGTAMLAKATDIRLNPFALKSGAGIVGAYSARSLCQHVLAAHAPRLEIDIGVSGREPLNNQPFFAEAMISDRLPVKPTQRQALEALLEALSHLEKIRDTNEARDVLRAFIKTRRRSRTISKLNPDSLGAFGVTEFIQIVEAFVRGASENGKRAQAVVAGLLDVFAPGVRVLSGRINDPDAKFPGDVVVLDATNQTVIEQAFEVRDKPFSEPDLYHFATKAAQSNVRKAWCVAVAGLACASDSLPRITEWARERGVSLLTYDGWHRFIPDVLNWSAGDLAANIRDACIRIEHRLVAIEASPEAVAQWSAAVGRCGCQVPTS